MDSTLLRAKLDVWEKFAVIKAGEFEFSAFICLTTLVECLHLPADVYRWRNPAEKVVCSTAHPSISWPAAGDNSSLCQNGLLTLSHLSSLLMSAVCLSSPKWKPLHVVSFPALFISQSGHRLSKGGEEGGTVANNTRQDKYEKWFSFSLSGFLFYFFLLSVFCILLPPFL